MLEMTMADRLRRTQFLGREFLTWLMYRATTSEGIFRLTDGRQIEVFFERALTLDGENPAREMASIKVDDPTQSQEVLLSLRLGKKISRARLMVLTEGREYSLVVDAASLGLRSVKLPDAPAMDPVENLVERTSFAAEIEDTLHSLFLDFIRIRIEPEAWSTEVGGMVQWIAS